MHKDTDTLEVNSLAQSDTRPAEALRDRNPDQTDVKGCPEKALAGARSPLLISFDILQETIEMLDHNLGNLRGRLLDCLIPDEAPPANPMDVDTDQYSGHEMKVLHYTQIIAGLDYQVKDILNRLRV